MPASGQRIPYLDEKIGVCARMLTEKGDIAAPERKLVAECISVPETTFNSAVNKGSLSTAIERKLTEKMGFAVDEPSWRGDGRGRQRNSESADALVAFELMLRSLPSFRRSPIRMKYVPRPDLDENMPYHAISIPSQSQSNLSRVPILLELEVQRTFSNGGVEFHFVKMRLSLRASTSPETFMEDRLGDGKPATLNNALVYARGTVLNPYWEIADANEAQLLGRYVTGDAPLFVMRVQTAPDSIETTLAANIFDGSVYCPEFKDQSTSNKENIIKLLIAREDNAMHIERGWLEIGRQCVEIYRDQT